MSLEYESRVTVLGKFGDVCQGPRLNWRHKCKDEIILNTPVVLADQLWRDLPYEPIVKESSTINFRDPSRLENGTSCDVSTANVDTEICSFVLPNLKPIRIGTQERDYTEWRDRFCEKYPAFRSYSPFRTVGNRIQFKTSDNSEDMMTFAGHVTGELSFAIWEHLLRTFWVGDGGVLDGGSVDNFTGFFKLYDDGIEPQRVGDCDYPVKPFCINMALYILGQAAVDAGQTAGPGDVVLAVGDPARPGDAPADNIITVHAGTQYETTLDITGFDTVDVLTSWYEFVVDQWGVPVFQWLLGVGQGQTKCLAEVAACKRACRGGDCKDLLISDSRDMARSDRESAFIKNKSIELYPYDPTFPLLQSPALKQRDKILFMPWSMELGGEQANSLLWVWRDQQAANESLFRDVPAFRQDILRGGLPATELHDLDEFPDFGTAFETRAWDWLYDQNKNCFQWWNNAETELIAQAPHLWMCIDGVDCSTVLVLPCNNPGRQVAIASCSATTPNSVFRVTFADPDGDFDCAVGSKVRIVSKNGDTNLQGEVTTIHSALPADPVDISITLDELGPYADCTWDGVALDAGGKVLYNLC